MKIPFAKSKGKRLPDILATFNKALTDLQSLVTSNTDSVQSNNAAIETLKTVNVELTAEAQQAQTVINNINTNILGKPKS